MKTKNIFKTVALAMLMPAMLLTTACSNQDDIANTSNITSKGYALPVTVNVTRGGDATTRATFDGSKLNFSDGDKLFVNGGSVSVGSFAGTLTWQSGGTFSGTIYTSKKWDDTADELFATAIANSGYTNATLLPNGYGSYGYLSIHNNNTYDDYVETNETYTCATSKADGVAQFSYEKATTYSSGFALAPQNAILNFTITGLAASTSVNVSLTSMAYNITGTVTTDAFGNATFAAGIMAGLNLQPFSLTVAGNPITIVSSEKVVEESKIYNITRAVTPPTLAQTMTTAGMTVKVKYNYANVVNYCLFSSVGDGTYTFQSGSGFAGGEEDDFAKALVVEGGKLVFKQNYFDTIDFQWSSRGFSVTFDTSNNTYSEWRGGGTLDYNPYFISVEVDGTKIDVTPAE